jgi:MFS family permease
MPYGVVGAFAMTVMPFLTARAQLDLDTIGWYSTALQLATVFLFLYAPVIDLGPKRKHWLVIVSVISAGCLLATCLMPLPEHTYGFLVLAMLAQIISGLVGSCNGGLMAQVIADDQQGKAGGWYQVGNQSGGGLSAAIAIWMSEAGAAPALIGGTLAGLMIVSSLAALWIDEPPRLEANAGAAFKETLREVKRLLMSRLGLTGVALCLSPVGTSALSYYFAAVAASYGVDGTAVAITVLANAGLTALGAFIGGYLCDRFNRRVLYLLAGVMTAVCGIAMALSPVVPATYFVGVAVYTLLTGFGYAAFTAVVLETIGKSSQASATQFSLYFAAGNAAIAYVGLIDTRFMDRHGIPGVVASDAALNLLGVVVLGVAFWRLGSFGKWRHPQEAT